MLKWQPLLTEYLVDTGSLPLLGVGQLLITQHPATVQAAGLTIDPPQPMVAFFNGLPPEMEVQQLAAYVGQQLSILPELAFQALSKEADFAGFTAAKESIDWPPFGRFYKTEEGNIAFQQEAVFTTYLPPLMLQPLQKGEPAAVQESTTAKAETTLAAEPAYEVPEADRSNAWWVWALVIFAISVFLIAFRLWG